MPVGIQMFATISSKDHLKSLQEDLHVLHNAKSYQGRQHDEIIFKDKFSRQKSAFVEHIRRYYMSFYSQELIRAQFKQYFKVG